MKLPESERPPLLEVEKRHFGHLSTEIVKFLVNDIQNDCHCSVEIYDSDPSPEWCALVLHPGKVEVCSGDRIVVPIHADTKLTKEDLSLLYAEACKQWRPSGYHDLIHSEKIGEIDGWEFVAPEPEFFGVLTCNLAGWGAFCFPTQLLRRRNSNV